MKYSVLATIILIASPVFAGSAYERALSHSRPNQPIEVEKLIIGCTTDPEKQKEVSVDYAPAGHHLHSGDEWVSLDIDPTIKPDIVADVAQLETKISKINSTVYIEHFNDTVDKPVKSTYLSKLIEKLYKIMSPGAKLYLDHYTMVEIITHFSDRTFNFFLNSPQNDNCEQSEQSKSPFWVEAGLGHFANRMDPESLDYDFIGHQAMIQDLARILRNKVQFMINVPSSIRHDREKFDVYLKNFAEMNLDNLIDLKDDPELMQFLAVSYYRHSMEIWVTLFLRDLGFQDIRIQDTTEKNPNPFNGRIGERLIVARKPG